jgi:hypothetical protein
MNQQPVLGDWEIPRISAIRTLESRRFVELPVPGRVGSLFQDLNTAPTRISISGSLYGDEARNDFLEKLREKYKAGDPVTFVADIVTATEVQYVVVETLRFEESGKQPDQTDYLIVLQESPPPPPPPDPLGGLDAGLLGDAAGLVGDITNAIDAVSKLADIPSFKDPTPALKGVVDGVKSATAGLGGIGSKLTDLFGGG